jgi:hypothetical protein
VLSSMKDDEAIIYVSFEVCEANIQVADVFRIMEVLCLILDGIPPQSVRNLGGVKSNVTP